MNKFVPERDLSPGVWQELLPQVLRIIDEIKKHGMIDPFWTFDGGAVRDIALPASHEQKHRFFCARSTVPRICNTQINEIDVLIFMPSSEEAVERAVKFLGALHKRPDI